jgi:UDP-N-acetylmuramoyl-tripeptide--D-alanyl-D-alanine ligase
VHVEFFESPRAVVREKRSLVTHLKPGGRVVVNGDDSNIHSIRQEFRGASVTYGFGADNDYTASHYEVLYEDGVPTGVRFRLEHDGSSIPIVAEGALGFPRVYAALAALAVAELAGVELVAASRGIATWTPQPGRLRLLKGIKRTVIIDDTYNSSPAAALAALDVLASVKTSGRRIAVLGDMLELGRYSSESHRALGERAAAVADQLITVGFRARAIGEAALDAGLADTNIREYEQGEAARAGKELEADLQAGDIILVKGSQSMRMEKTVEEIMAEPQKAGELLVRQDREWKDR